MSTSKINTSIIEGKKKNWNCILIKRLGAKRVKLGTCRLSFRRRHRVALCSQNETDNDDNATKGTMIARV